MQDAINKSQRIHALDALRAIMMMLGLVIHTAITYGTIDYGSTWTIKDPESTDLIMDWIVYLIHNFRMPIFFIVSGFFGALLFYDRSASKMISNRLKRVMYPFVVFLFLLFPLVVFSFIYTGAVFAGAENSLSIALASASNWTFYIPFSTLHLWFLYYLMLLSVVFFGLALFMKRFPNFCSQITRVFGLILKRPILKVILFSLLTFLALILMGQAWVETSTGLLPNIKTLFFYGLFYSFGWILFKTKELLSTFKKYDWQFTCIGLIFITANFLLITVLPAPVYTLVNALCVWLFSFGMTGLFFRFTNKESALMRYISDASYWVYLVHLTIVVFLPAFIASWQVPVFIKFLTVLTGTTLICFVSYQYMVRSTFIGQFLNGRKYGKDKRIGENASVGVQSSTLGLKSHRLSTDN